MTDSGDTPEPIVHGGGRDAAAARYGIAAADWLDLSTGINPTPYPTPPPDPEAWHRLPDGAAEAALRGAAATCYEAPESARVVAVPGSQAAIQWLPRLLREPADVAVRGPTYAEHARCWAMAGHRVHQIRSVDEVPEFCRTVVVVNPNNPTGHVEVPSRLMALANEGRTVIVDEAFADEFPTLSMTPRTNHPNVIVLRSLGKFFGLAGLRLGFVLGSGRLVDALADAIGPWAIHGPALDIGAQALADEDWIAETRYTLAARALRLDHLLTASGLRVLGGTSLFRLADIPGAAGVFERLCEQGLLARKFPEHPTWLRFGLPGGDDGFDRLGVALRDAVGPRPADGQGN